MAFRLIPYFPGIERMNTWMQLQFDRFREEEVTALVKGRRFPNFYLADDGVKNFRPAEAFGAVIISAKENADTYGMFAYSYSGTFLSAVAIGADVSVIGTTASKTNVYLDGNQVVVENKEGTGRTYHVVFV